MELFVMICAVLLFWIFSLQNRLKSLEKVVSTLQDKLTGLHIERETRIEEARKKDMSHEEATVSRKAVPETTSLDPIAKSTQEAGSSWHTAYATYKEELHSETKERPTESSMVVNHPEEKLPDTNPLGADSAETPVVAAAIQNEPNDYVPPQAVPKEPSWIVSLLVNYFTGGNLLVRIGGVVLFFGLAFLVKYAAEHSTLSMSARLVMIALLAVGLIVGGWVLRSREGAYGQILQGLGVAILYLVIYGAARFYTLLSLEGAFGLMLVVVIVGSLLALVQNSLPLVLFAVIGGFAAPILTSSGDGSHVVLFGYYALLNLGIFTMAWYRSWRILNLTGFVFTFVIATGWGVLRYRSDLFGTTEPFLILFFLMYLTITILFTRRGEDHLVDSTLTFGLPAVAFGLQVALTEQFEYGAGWSAVALGGLYLLLASRFRRLPDTGLLFGSFLGLGVLFLTIAIPYFFDANVTAALWAMESSAVIWLALRQSRTLPRYIGEALLLISLVLYLFSMADSGGITLSEYLGYAVVYLSLFITAYHLKKNEQSLTYDHFMPYIVLLLSLGVWFISASEVAWEWDRFAYGHTMMLSVVVLSLLLFGANRWVSWELIPRLIQATLPLGMIFGIMQFADLGTLVALPHPFAGIGLPVWFGLFGWHMYLLYRYREQWSYALPLHIASFWGAILILTLELRWQVAGWVLGHSATFVSTSLIPLVSAVWVHQRARFDGWMAPYRMAYRLIGVGGLTGVLILWQLVAFFHISGCTLIPYVPIFNLLDLTQIAVAGLSGYWLHAHAHTLDTGVRRVLAGVWIISDAVLISILFVRAMHHYLSIEYTFFSLGHSLYVQTGLALLWSGMVGELLWLHRRFGYRILWLSAGGMLAVMMLWEVRAFFHSPDFSSWYLPVLNLIDLAQLAVLAAASAWVYLSRNNLNTQTQNILSGILAATGFLLLSVVFARAVHQYKLIPYTVDGLWHSLFFQTGFTLLWSVTAIVLMLLSRRYAYRQMWMAGFGLLGLVVVKLFFVELANSGTIERIISFIVVGALLLVIGYFVPLPPGRHTENS
jgi:uncharacterized membrane protein